VNDFAFKKTFGSIENKPALISLLNAILDAPSPIVLRSGDDYSVLRPVYSICLANGILWREATQVHHAFCLTDQDSRRTLKDTIHIHTLELGRYNLLEADLTTASSLNRWLYWFLHAHEYEPEALLKLFPETAMQLATQTITRIAEITNDKIMYDAREKAIRDHQWALNSAHREGVLEGKLKGEIRLIRTLELILSLPLSHEADLEKQSLEELQKLSSVLQDGARNRV